MTNEAILLSVSFVVQKIVSIGEHLWFQLISRLSRFSRFKRKFTDACEQASLPKPIIEEESGGVEVSLLKATSSEKLGNQLGNIKERILAEMRANPKISGAQLAEILDISTTAIEKNIKHLRDEGLIKRIGGTRGHWEIIERDEG